MDILVATETRVDFGVSDESLTLLELRKDVVGAVRRDNILAEGLLGGQNDVSHLGEVLNHDVRLIARCIEQLAGSTPVHPIVVHELFKEWVENPQEV